MNYKQQKIYGIIIGIISLAAIVLTAFYEYDKSIPGFLGLSGMITFCFVVLMYFPIPTWFTKEKFNFKVTKQCDDPILKPDRPRVL